MQLDISHGAARFFDSYAEWTDTVAKYPPTAEPFYLALGIADEAGELTAARTLHDQIKEAGDVLWYCARYSVRVLDIPFSDLIAQAVGLGFVSTHRLSTNIGVICGVEKKRIRDGELWDADKRIQKAADSFRALVMVVAWVLYVIGEQNLHVCLHRNVEKLMGRSEAGTLRGDGDHR